MTTGVMLFSFNNEHTSYDRLTRRCIKHIKKYLQLPVTVVGDRKFEGANNIIVKPTAGNKRQYLDAKGVVWYNLERSNAYDLSPYDTTILLDCDYFVMTDKLKELAKGCENILLHDKVFDIAEQNNLWDQRDATLPLVWATVVIFKKTAFVKSVFDLVKHIKKNYMHYKYLYRLKFATFRNDYAFAIALHQLYGPNNKAYCIPHPMMMMGYGAEVLNFDMNSLTYKWKNNYATLYQQDVHVFNKEFIDEL